MLVIIDPKLAADAHSLADTVKGLDPIWQLGWEVALIRPDGFTTPFLTHRQYDNPANWDKEFGS